MKEIQNIKFIILVFICILLTSCTNRVDNFEEEYEYLLECDPLDISQDRIYEYSGKEIEFTYMIKNGESDFEEIGIMMFTNGLPQKFKIDNNEYFLYPMNISNKSTNLLDIKFEPILGKKDEELCTNIVIMFKPSITNPEEILDQQILQAKSVFIKMNEDSKKQELFQGYNDLEKKDISEETIKNNITPYGDNLLDMYLSLGLFEDMKSPYINISESNTIKPTFISYGAETKNCKTTFFINHKPIKILNKYDYLNYDIDKYIETIFSEEMDISEYIQEYNIIYTMTIYDKENSPLKELSNQIIKSQTKILKY